MTVTADIASVRTLSAKDLPSIERVLATDPVAHCFVASRARSGGVDPWRMGGELLGYVERDTVVSLLYCGANLVPVGTHDESREAFAQRLRQTGRRCSSIVGTRNEVLDLWNRLEPRWGRAREVRSSQPLLAISGPPRVTPDPAVRVSESTDLDALLPACIDMFLGEVGVSPVAGGMSAAYRARIAELIAQGRSFIRSDSGSVTFKAEIGAATDDVCQVQGVWVAHERRGTGISEPAMAAVVALARESIAPTVSLYVNDFNVAARRCYEAVGFQQCGEFATVLF